MKFSILPIALATIAGTSIGASAQTVHFSIDWRSPTNGISDSATGIPIVSGDIMEPAAGDALLGPLLAPSTVFSHGAPGLGLMPGCVGSAAGVACPVEVDAFSYGFDDAIHTAGVGSGAFQWSVDAFASGYAPIAPNVESESLMGDAAADVMLNVGFYPPLPLGPAGPLGHRGLFDGNGLISGSGYVYPGLGLIEPTTLSPAAADTGDNLDALDILPTGMGPGLVGYFSLDTTFTDPLTGLPHNGTAFAHGFASGDVLKSTSGSSPALYAAAPLLGLDLVAGVDSDDLDALVLLDNGDGLYTPSHQPFDWLSGSTDMLLFSVRRGSAVIGMPDSIFGIPIEEGDILTAPLATAFGGVSPYPGIMVAAEILGLATLRSGIAFTPFADDLNALDHGQGGYADCDGDGMDDTIAIAFGAVVDLNANGIPDVCEGYLTCTPYPNSTGVPTLLTASVTGSPGSGFHLEATSGPVSQFGYFLVATDVDPLGLIVASGNLCLSGTLARYNVAGTAMNSIGLFDAAGVLHNLAGTSTVGSGFDVPSTIPVPIGGIIMVGTTLHFQLWHRDVGMTSNFSNSVSF